MLSAALSYRRLRNAHDPGSAASFHALTQVSAPTTGTADTQKNGALQAAAAPPRTEITTHRFFLTTPAVMSAIHRHCGNIDVTGLELSLNKSGPNCEYVGFLQTNSMHSETLSRPLLRCTCASHIVQLLNCTAWGKIQLGELNLKCLLAAGPLFHILPALRTVFEPIYEAGRVEAGYRRAGEYLASPLHPSVQASKKVGALLLCLGIIP